MEKFIKQLLRDAGAILREKFGKITVANTKAHALDFVTEADLAADKLITDRIKKKFPTHAIISEESGEYNRHSNKWIIDPLDGTNNFLLGIPLFVTQLAFVQSNRIKFSAIYDPIHERLYFAERNKGSFLNNKKIRCANNTNLRSSQGAFDFYFNDGFEVLTKINRSIKDKSFWARNLGSAGTTGTLISRGSLDWSIMIGGANIWDYAPSALLVREAGGVVKNFMGKDWQMGDRGFIAGNSALVKKLVSIVNTS
ncbi:MAG: inositol monophosphatase [Candidatus Doudnabacteria bacterium]|nr:inositol monophosphatase [Candidatus Doudnabacteria bacterium]